MKKQEIIEILVNDYNEDRDDLEEMSKEDLQSMLMNYEDHSDLFPNGDEFDGSHEWD